VNFTINPEDHTVADTLSLLHWFTGKRCWFSLTETEGYFDNTHTQRERPRRLVATVLRAYALPDFEIRVDTSEGVLALQDFFSVEPYERYNNDGKDRYTPA